MFGAWKAATLQCAQRLPVRTSGRLRGPGRTEPRCDVLVASHCMPITLDARRGIAQANAGERRVRRRLTATSDAHKSVDSARNIQD